MAVWHKGSAPSTGYITMVLTANTDTDAKTLLQWAGRFLRQHSNTYYMNDDDMVSLGMTLERLGARMEEIMLRSDRLQTENVLLAKVKSYVNFEASETTP